MTARARNERPKKKSTAVKPAAVKKSTPVKKSAGAKARVAGADSPVERVMTAFTRVAIALGFKDFAQQARQINTTGFGPVNTFSACRKLVEHRLGAAAKERLDRSLIGKCVSGTICERAILVGEPDEFDRALVEAGVGPIVGHHIRFDRYPAQLQTLLVPKRPNRALLGMDGETVLLAEKRDNGSVIYVATPVAVTEHDAVTWFETGLSSLLRDLAPPG